jgi:hypothetical protein
MKEYKRVTADLVLDLYLEAKKNKGVKKDQIMKKVIYLSQHLNERINSEIIRI